MVAWAVWAHPTIDTGITPQFMPASGVNDSGLTDFSGLLILSVARFRGVSFAELPVGLKIMYIVQAATGFLTIRAKFFDGKSKNLLRL
ncbi:hypothetical protein [Jannaschia sp. 2305UL9-9]|uniref:hypothetical protein n=1 Tax=Jannaschia sp. 2305UL9-9 TaxID=3121638 RepID=UPI0035278E82